MHFQITISGQGDELTRALQTLKAATAGQVIASGEVTATIEETAAAEAPKADKPARSRQTAKPEPAKEEEPVKKEEDSGSDQGQDDGNDDPLDVPTVVELRAKAQEVGRTPEGKKAIKELLDKFGSKSISDVQENQRVAFMAALEELA